MARDRFRDGAGLLPTYEWDVGHETEDPVSAALNLERTAVTTGEGFVRQQGAPTPQVFKLAGWIIKEEQKAIMEDYFNACKGLGGTPSRTVFWQDISGTEREVLITDFAPQRQIGRSGETGLTYVWKYTLTMEVIS